MLDDLLLTLGRWLWVVAYVACMWVGRRDKSCAMPLLALVGNFSWEVVHAPISLARFGWTDSTVAFATWLALDLGIVWTYFHYEIFGRQTAYCAAVLRFARLLTVAIVCQLVAVVMLGAVQAQLPMAFLVNLVMSADFLMLLQKRGTRGQSQIIAVSKLLGTLFYTVLAGLTFGWFAPLTLLGFVVALLDILYVIVLAVRQRHAQAGMLI